MTDGATILIPVFNEQEIIEANTNTLVKHMETLSLPFEIIILSNGSTDGTNNLGRSLADSHECVRFFELPEKGVGRAFRLGVEQASFDLIISVDMDLSIDLGFIRRAVHILENYEIVVGSKKMGSQNRKLWRKAGSTTFIICVRILLGLPFEDYSIAAKGYHRKTIIKYLDRIDYGTSYVLDIIYHTMADGGLALEIPVFCEDYRASKFNLVNEALYRFKNVFLLWIKYHMRASAKRVV